ncbi:MAG: VWA domain-containing protein [Candidatus Aegiribacteria sp.]|nr:VWA domain-containing protein [Candidatus Aegiribacteria sp.]
MRKSFVLAVIMSIFIQSVASAQSTGTIAGGVFDIYGNPLTGATVMVVGTSLGAMTDGNGEYVITDVEPGTYDVSAFMVGLSSLTATGVEVKAGETVTMDFGSRNSTPATVVEEPEDLPEITLDDLPEAAFEPVFDDNPRSGRFQASTEDGIVFDLPLEHTEVEISVSGCMQRATVRQVYGNPAEGPIEAVYTFPLPQDGAVSSMNMYIGDKLIKGMIYEREQAEQVYHEAIESGRTASMLSQERPNIFTQSVGNILPGDSITIEISYVAPVHYDDGEYEIIFPMVVGPRFIPGTPTGPSTSGWFPPTDIVPDADLITPPVVPEGTRPGYDIELTVNINAGLAIQNLESPNHEIKWNINSDGLAYIMLENHSEIPNRDFVLRYTTATDRLETAVLTHIDELGNHFMLIVQPEDQVDVERITPKELFFVVDCSGSMSGQPMEVAKETVRQFVSGMNPYDTFQIMRFSETASSMSSEPMPNTDENVLTGLNYIDAMSGGGGTHMIEGIKAAIGYPEDPERLRFVLFLTDGYIGNETQILAEVQSALGENIRLFSVGVGSSPNRYLIESLAEEGRGQAFYVGLNDNPSESVAAIYNKINNPYIMNFEIDWGNLEVYDIYPSNIQDIYPGTPLFIVGKYDGSGTETIKLMGSVAMNSWSQNETITLPEDSESNEAIAILWAREKIHDLNRQLLTSEYSGPIVSEITAIALEYQILSSYTSFVAVSEEVRTDSTGNTLTVQVPVNMPDGVSYEGVFGSGTPPQGAGSINVVPRGMVGTMPVSGGVSGLQPSTVGSTTIIVTDSRGMLLERRSLSSLSPRVNMVYIHPDLGLTSYQLSVSLHEIKEYLLIEFLEILRAFNDSDIQSYFPEGIISFDIAFDGNGNADNVEIIFNETGSDELAEKAADILEDMQLPTPPEGAGTITISLQFNLGG